MSNLEKTGRKQNENWLLASLPDVSCAIQLCASEFFWPPSCLALPQ